MALDFNQQLRNAQDTTERMLGRLIDAPLPEGGEPAVRLQEAMRYAALSGGKRLRPFVVIEAARLFGKAGDGVARVGAALECVHCYSLAHDDLPAMDDDDLRRGQPTLHRAFDEATAILAGDALLTLAFAVLADRATDPDPAVRLALVAGLADAAGHAGMAGGQMLDLTATAATDAEAVARLQGMKTGALFRYAAEAGAIIGRATSSERASLARFGTALGAAFQVADDLIDATATVEAAGKATAKDAARGKATLVSLHGIAGAHARLAELIADAQAALRGFGSRGEMLAKLAESLDRPARAAVS